MAISPGKFSSSVRPIEPANVRHFDVVMTNLGGERPGVAADHEGPRKRLRLRFEHMASHAANRLCRIYRRVNPEVLSLRRIIAVAKDMNPSRDS